MIKISVSVYSSPMNAHQDPQQVVKRIEPAGTPTSEPTAGNEAAIIDPNADFFNRLKSIRDTISKLSSNVGPTELDSDDVKAFMGSNRLKEVIGPTGLEGPYRVITKCPRHDFELAQELRVTDLDRPIVYEADRKEAELLVQYGGDVAIRMKAQGPLETTITPTLSIRELTNIQNWLDEQGIEAFPPIEIDRGAEIRITGDVLNRSPLILKGRGKESATYTVLRRSESEIKENLLARFLGKPDYPVVESRPNSLRSELFRFSPSGQFSGQLFSDYKSTEFRIKLVRGETPDKDLLTIKVDGGDQGCHLLLANSNK